MGPAMRNASFPVAALTDLQGQPLAAANPNQRVRMTVPDGTAPLDLLRRED
jgi:hypothetical protein